MRLDAYTPRFPIQLARPNSPDGGQDALRSWHSFKVGEAGVISIEAMAEGVAVSLREPKYVDGVELVGERPTRKLLLNDQGWGYVDVHESVEVTVSGYVLVDNSRDAIREEEQPQPLPSTTDQLKSSTQARPNRKRGRR